jgi:hypothetical protein
MIPFRTPGTYELPVGDELVLIKPNLASDGEAQVVVNLNASGAMIWGQCDGKSDLSEIERRLRIMFDVGDGDMSRQIEATVIQLSRLGVLEGVETVARPGITFAVGIEDKPYFWWQLAILAESLCAELPVGWTLHVTICNDQAPLSADLMAVLESYPVTYSLAKNHAVPPRIDMGEENWSGYAPLNRIEALRWAADHATSGHLICLLDSDMFLFGQIDPAIFPTKTALAWNRHVEFSPFFTSEARNTTKAGVDLGKVLEAIGCEVPMVNGAVFVVVERSLAQEEKFIADCFRFAEVVYLLGRAAGVSKAWIAEMPCFAMALANAGAEPELLTCPEFLVPRCDEVEIAQGSFYHYYSDPIDAGITGFAESDWFKQMFRETDMLRSDLPGFLQAAKTEHERRFFQLAQAALARVSGR